MADIAAIDPKPREKEKQKKKDNLYGNAKKES